MSSRGLNFKSNQDSSILSSGYQCSCGFHITSFVNAFDVDVLILLSTSSMDEWVGYKYKCNLIIISVWSWIQDEVAMILVSLWCGIEGWMDAVEYINQVGYGLYLSVQFALQSNPQGIDLKSEEENNSYLLQRIWFGRWRLPSFDGAVTTVIVMGIKLFVTEIFTITSKAIWDLKFLWFIKKYFNIKPLSLLSLLTGQSCSNKNKPKQN